jgi:RNA recognition motif-containing protein
VADNSNSNRLFVGSLPWSITSDDLRLLFSRIGTVTDAVVLTDKKSGKSKGYGFVELEDPGLIQAAIDKFNGYELKGRTIVVNSAEPKSPKTLFMG